VVIIDVLLFLLTSPSRCGRSVYLDAELSNLCLAAAPRLFPLPAPPALLPPAPPGPGDPAPFVPAATHPSPTTPPALPVRPAKRLPLAGVRGIMFGPRTPIFAAQTAAASGSAEAGMAVGWKDALTAASPYAVPWRCFSVVMAERTVDLIALSDADCEVGEGRRRGRRARRVVVARQHKSRGQRQLALARRGRRDVVLWSRDEKGTVHPRL